MAADPRLRRIPTADLSLSQRTEIRALLERAFADDADGFTDEDWAHALGGTHVVLVDGDRTVGHAAVVDRDIRIGGRALRTAYVEAVAVEPVRQRAGLGTAVMREVADLVRESYDLGVLDSGSPAFYERLGWRVWPGPSGVRGDGGQVTPTPGEDGGILVLSTETTPPLDDDAPITCEWRPGDVW